MSEAYKPALLSSGVLSRICVGFFALIISFSLEFAFAMIRDPSGQVFIGAFVPLTVWAVYLWSAPLHARGRGCFWTGVGLLFLTGWLAADVFLKTQAGDVRMVFVAVPPVAFLSTAMAIALIMAALCVWSRPSQENAGIAAEPMAGR